MGRLVVLGSINADIVSTVPALPVPGATVLGTSVEVLPGGKGLNQAVAAARAGAEVALAGCIGQDQWGDELMAFLRTTTVDDSHVRRAGTPTGVAVVTVAADGTNTIVVVPGANRCDDIEAVVTDAVTSVGPDDVVLVQLELPPAVVHRAVETARDRGAMVVLNPSPIAEAESGDVRRCLASATVVVANEGEAATLDLPAERTPGQVVIVTKGPDAVTVTDDEDTFSVPPRPTTAIDTTGAGDCFAGVLAAGLATGAALRPSVSRAVVAASLQVGRAGAAPAMPHAAEIDAATD